MLLVSEKTLLVPYSEKYQPWITYIYWSFQMHHIAFLLLLELVNFLSLKNTLGFWYVFHETIEFWCIGYKLMEGKFLRLMGRIKHTGIVVSKASPKKRTAPLLLSTGTIGECSTFSNTPSCSNGTSCGLKNLGFAPGLLWSSWCKN